jgi:predicted metal-dependent RNase
MSRDKWEPIEAAIDRFDRAAQKLKASGYGTADEEAEAKRAHKKHLVRVIKHALEGV